MTHAMPGYMLRKRHPNRRPDMHYAIVPDPSGIDDKLGVSMWRVTHRDSGAPLCYHLVNGCSVTINRQMEPLLRIIAGMMQALEGES